MILLAIVSVYSVSDMNYCYWRKKISTRRLEKETGNRNSLPDYEAWENGHASCETHARPEIPNAAGLADQTCQSQWWPTLVLAERRAEISERKIMEKLKIGSDANIATLFCRQPPLLTCHPRTSIGRSKGARLFEWQNIAGNHGNLPSKKKAEPVRRHLQS